MRRFLAFLFLLLLVVPTQAQSRDRNAIRQQSDALPQAAKTRQKLTEWRRIFDEIELNNASNDKMSLVRQVRQLDSLQDVVALYYNSLFWDYLLLECKEQKVTPRSLYYKGYSSRLVSDTIPRIKKIFDRSVKYKGQNEELCRADSGYVALDNLQSKMLLLSPKDSLRIDWHKKQHENVVRLHNSDPRIAKAYERMRKSSEGYMMEVLNYLVGWFRKEKIWLPYGDMVSAKWVPFLHKRYPELLEVEKFRREVRGLGNRHYLRGVSLEMGIADLRKDYAVDSLQQSLLLLDSLQARHEVIFTHCVWERYLQRVGRTHKADKLITHFETYADSSLVDTIPHLASLHRICHHETEDYNRLFRADPEYPILEQEREELKGLPEKHFSRTLYQAHEDEVRERIYRKNPLLMKMRKNRSLYRDQFYLALIRELNEDCYRRGVTLLPVEWIDAKEVEAIMVEYGDAKRLMERFATFRILRFYIETKIEQKIGIAHEKDVMIQDES